MSELRRWIARHPHPSSLRCDDGEKTVRVGVTRSKFRDAENALAGVSGRIEALDESGAILRAIDVEVPEGSEAAKKKAAVGQDSNQAMLTRFAELLTDGMDKAAARHEAAYRMGFDHQATLINLLSTRLSQLEKAWHGMIMAQPEGSAQPDSNLSAVMTLLGAAAPGLLTHLSSGANGANGKPNAT